MSLMTALPTVISVFTPEAGGTIPGNDSDQSLEWFVFSGDQNVRLEANVR